MLPSRRTRGKTRRHAGRTSADFARRLFFEGLETRRLLAADGLWDLSPWHNVDQPLDTNGDGSVTPLDFLVVANAVQRQGGFPHQSGASGGLADLFATGATEGTLPDVNGDWYVTAMDALLLANAWLDAGEEGTGGSGVGESDDGGVGSDGSDTGDFGDGAGTGDPGTGDPGTGDPGTGDPGTGDPGTGDPGTGDPGTGDPGTGDPGTGDPGTGDPGAGDPGTGDPGVGDPGGGDPGTGGSGSGGGGGDTCGTPAVTISAPATVTEFTVFTVSGVAKGADQIRFTVSGNWAFVDTVGNQPGKSYDRNTGAYSRMMIFKDDAVPGTSADRETITVEVTGSCPGTASTTVLVQNAGIAAEYLLEDSELDENDSTSLIVRYSDAVRDGHTVEVDWGDGTTDTHNYGDPPLAAPLVEVMAMTDLPQRITFTDWFHHRYEDDNPTATPRDKYTVTILVSDNDGSHVTLTETIVVHNVPPAIVLEPLIPLDDQLPNGRIDETEGFILRGKVTDIGKLDTIAGVVKADLNGDGDTEDPGEQSAITQAGDFEIVFDGVPDDGPSPGNGTASDPVEILVEVSDDDRGTASAAVNAEIFNAAPRMMWDGVRLSYTRDSDGDIDSVTLAGGFEDLGSSDRHQLDIQWGDGGAGNGLMNPVPLSGSSFSVTRALPKSFGSSIRRILPVNVRLLDDDAGVDAGLVDGASHWAFEQHPAAGEVKDLSPRLVEPFAVPQFAGAKWKGYGQASAAEVPLDTNVVTGFAKAASAVAYGDFTKDLHFRAASGLNFSVTCDREAGTITASIQGGGGMNSMTLRDDGKFLGWDPTRQDLPRNGPMIAATLAEVTVTPSAGEKVVQIRADAQFGLSSNVTVIDENQGQFEGLGGKLKVSVKRGTSFSYQGGYSDVAKLQETYICRERLTTTTTDLED